MGGTWPTSRSAVYRSIDNPLWSLHNWDYVRYKLIVNPETIVQGTSQRYHMTGGAIPNIPLQVPNPPGVTNRYTAGTPVANWSYAIEKGFIFQG